MSVFSFLKIIAKLNKYEHILEYNNNPILQEKIAGFKCKMGFGIHQGWAIEGAIGSYFKVDASYLSPNVNMAARLEAATKQFGTLLLISGPLKSIMSDEMQNCCREIDTVTVKGSIKPVKLFTIDIDVNDLLPSTDPMMNKRIKAKKQMRDQMRHKMFEQLYSQEKTTWQEINTDYEFIELRKNYDQDFEDLFKQSYKFYIDGDWELAGQGFQKLVELRPYDGPS